MKKRSATSRAIIFTSAVGFVKRISAHIAIALCAICAMGVGTVNATLIGDTVTAGHYFPDGTTPLSGPTPPTSFAVVAGNADVYTFYNSYPFGYKVNVESASISVDFSHVIQADETGTWLDEYQSCGFGGNGFECNPAPASFNGLGVSDLDDSTGNDLQSVLVNTNMSGWDSSRLSFGADYVLFDWKGLSFDSNTYLNASLDFGQIPAAIPEPETYAMMMAGLGLLGFAVRRRKQKEAAAA